jgi:TetR/AcrR family transcriptional regulator
VQNTHYAEAIEEGLRVSAATKSPLDAIMALVQPVVECNRRQIENGRTYLRELVFGDPKEPHHAIGLALIQQVDDAYVEILQRDARFSATDAALLARTMSATMFVSLASPAHLHSTDQQVCDDIREHVRVLLRH